MGCPRQKDGPTGHLARRNWLKTKHNIGNNAAWWIVDHAEGKGGEEDSRISRRRRRLRGRPIRRQEILGKSLGPDVKACPCKTMVPLYRHHVFAQIKPTTNTRVDFGLCFSTYKGRLPKRLIDTGGLAKKDRITHRIELGSLSQIDGDLKKWLQAAYDLDS